MRTESEIFSEGREISSTRAVRVTTAAGAIAVTGTMAGLLWASSAQAHPGHGAAGVTATLLHCFREPAHGLLAFCAAAVLIGLTGLAVASPRMRRSNP